MKTKYGIVTLMYFLSFGILHSQFVQTKTKSRLLAASDANFSDVSVASHFLPGSKGNIWNSQALPSCRITCTFIDTTGTMLKIKKRRFFIYQDQEPQKISKGFDYSDEFKNAVKLVPEAYNEFKKARYYSYGQLVGITVILGLATRDFINTLNDVKEVNSGTIPDSSFKIGDIIPYFFAAGFTIYCSLESHGHFKKGLKIYNAAYR